MDVWDLPVSDETKKALRNIGKSDLQIADADIRKVVLQHWEASSSTCCSAELSKEAMDQIRAAIGGLFAPFALCLPI